MRYLTSRTIAALAAVLTVATACGPPGASSSEPASSETSEVAESSVLGLRFEAAALTFDVPVDLLKAIAYVETRFEPAVGVVEFDGQPAPYGIFALRSPELEHAASLVGLSVDEVRGVDESNILAAAALLDHYAWESGIAQDDRTDVRAWAPALARLGNLDDPAMRDVFVREVFSVLNRGVAVPMTDKTTIVVAKHGGLQTAVENESIARVSRELRSPLAIWRPSPNFNSRGGRSPELVIIHTCEGSYAGCVSWLRNSASGVSAHYVVNESGSEISQLVEESNRAWHVSARYRSSLNEGRLAHLDGISINTLSIGIEHGGRASQSSWPQGQIDSSVALVRDITERNNIPRDRYHIVAHGQLQPENRVDPGPNWPWVSYLAAISGDQSPGTITVDNTTSGRFRASSSWGTSSWASGKVGTNYRYRAPAFTSDSADYRVNIASAGSYEVFARIPGNGYNTRQPYVIHHAGGTTVVHRNISGSGASWVSLGTYGFNAVDDWIVQISCWTTGTGWIIADAIRFERR